MATFALNYAISGDATWSWHLFNMLLHWIAALLVFRIVRDHLWLGDEAPLVAGAAALIVAVHPLEHRDARLPLGALGAAHHRLLPRGLRHRAPRPPRRVPRLLFALAMLTKAIALTLPLVLLAYFLLDRTRRPAPRRPMPWGFSRP